MFPPSSRVQVRPACRTHVTGLNHWRHLLVGTSTPITVYTDHKNLEYYQHPQHINRRVARYIPRLADYSYTLVHLPGDSNKADALSQRPDLHLGADDNDEVLVLPLSLFAHAFYLLRSRPWWVLHGARSCLSFIRIGLSHCCITGLASLSHGLCLFVSLFADMSRRSPQPSFDAWGCTSTLLCYLIDRLMYACVDAWSWVSSVGG